MILARRQALGRSGHGLVGVVVHCWSIRRSRQPAQRDQHLRGRWAAVLPGHSRLADGRAGTDRGEPAPDGLCNPHRPRDRPDGRWDTTLKAQAGGTSMIAVDERSCRPRLPGACACTRPGPCKCDPTPREVGMKGALRRYRNRHKVDTAGMTLTIQKIEPISYRGAQWQRPTNSAKQVLPGQ